ncbi:MAG TPA: HAD family hydrolase [Herpetosiphonaceae bacterium]
MRLQGAILDVDGTLVLSNDAHAQAWVEAFAEHGYAVPFERVRPLIGMGGDKLLPAVIPGLSDRQGVGKAIAERRKAIFAECYAPTLKPASGARQLLLRLRDDGLRLIVASSAKKDELESLLKAAQVEDLIADATTSSDAEESKPAPDIVGAALEKLGLEPAQVIMLGDTPYDIESAGACGVGVIAVRSGGFDDRQLADACAIYDDPADLLAHYESSPLRA